MLKKTIVFLCLLTNVALLANIDSHTQPENTDPNTPTKKTPVDYVQKVKKINHILIGILINQAEDSVCAMVGGNQTLVSFPLRNGQEATEGMGTPAENNNLSVLETKDVINIATTVMKKIATSEQKTLKPLTQECAREAAKTYIGNKVYRMCRSQEKDIAILIKKHLPEPVTDIISEINNEINKEPVVSTILETTWPIILQGSIALALDIIDNSLFSHDTKRKP